MTPDLLLGGAPLPQLPQVLGLNIFLLSAAWGTHSIPSDSVGGCGGGLARGPSTCVCSHSRVCPCPTRPGDDTQGRPLPTLVSGGHDGGTQPSETEWSPGIRG